MKHSVVAKSLCLTKSTEASHLSSKAAKRLEKIHRLVAIKPDLRSESLASPEAPSSPPLKTYSDIGRDSRYPPPPSECCLGCSG